MNDVAYALFDTAIGRCAIPGASAASRRCRCRRRAKHRCGRGSGGTSPTRTRRRRRPISRPRSIASAPCLKVAATISQTSRSTWQGQPEFHQRVYQLARAIPPGETKTYGEIAAALGDKTLSRAVGQALGRNPWPIVVPCHRVLAANGKTGGFSADGGVDTKMRMLTIEGAGKSTEPQLFDALPLAAKPRR